jgi:linoleate 9S-lipoxygenase
VNGVIEKTFTPGKFSLEISSKIYGALWHFADQGLPNDLLKRGMAVEDATSESGVKLNFEDYPYAQDGLDLWCAFKSWVTDYVNIYYADDKIVQQDIELQQWWSEIRTKGHGDKKDAPGWPSLTSKASLVETLTTILWIPSAHHAAVNFGQYAYTGYMPNQPAVMRRPVPEVNSKEHSQLLASPEKFFLQSHGKPSQATIVMTVVEILSKHAQEEEYIGQRLVEGWTNNNEVLAAFQKYGEKLQAAAVTMKERNQNPSLPNRRGPAKLPYTLLYPKSEKHGLTGMGVPNSISI